MARFSFRHARIRGRLANLALLAGLLLLLAWLRAPEQLTDAEGMTVRVMDGDSLRIGTRIVRIGGIDAVELHQQCKMPDGAVWSCGRDARAALHEMVARGDLVCRSREEDRYGRALAQCAVRDVADVGAALVRQGWAVSGDGRGNGHYRTEQAAAQAASRGIWQGRFDRPGDWRAANRHPRD